MSLRWKVRLPSWTRLTFPTTPKSGKSRHRVLPWLLWKPRRHLYGTYKPTNCLTAPWASVYAKAAGLAPRLNTTAMELQGGRGRKGVEMGKRESGGVYSGVWRIVKKKKT